MYIVAIFSSEIACRFSTGGRLTIKRQWPMPGRTCPGAWTSADSFLKDFKKTPGAFQTSYGARSFTLGRLKRVL